MTVSASSALVEKGEYRHFMEKEIHEQPDSVQHTLSHYLDLVTGKAKVQSLEAGAFANSIATAQPNKPLEP